MRQIPHFVPLVLFICLSSLLTGLAQIDPSDEIVRCEMTAQPIPAWRLRSCAAAKSSNRDFQCAFRIGTLIHPGPPRVPLSVSSPIPEARGTAGDGARLRTSTPTRCERSERSGGVDGTRTRGLRRDSSVIMLGRAKLRRWHGRYAVPTTSRLVCIRRCS